MTSSVSPRFLQSGVLLPMLMAVTPADTGEAIVGDNGHIEYSTLIQSDSMQDLHSFSAYSPLQARRQRSLSIYAGMELVWYQLTGQQDYIFNTRIFLGVTGRQRLSPFAELGSNLVNLIVFDEHEGRNCSNDSCDPDIDIKLGLKYRLNTHFSAGFFYQGIHFGNFHDRLTGNHNVVGAFFGLHF